MRYFPYVMVLLAVAGCARRPGSEATPAAEAAVLQAADMSGLQRRQHDAATAARDELFERLSARLMAAMSEGGPAAAIPVCKTEAAGIAVEVGDKHGLQIGRTSHRLRNPRNAPPDWARPFVEREAGEAMFVTLPENRLGALLPIRLKAVCLMCHGPQDALAPGVEEVLRAEYPVDQATGFQEGDLRGWFWVVVPADLATVPSNSVDTSAENQGTDIAP